MAVALVDFELSQRKAALIHGVCSVILSHVSVRESLNAQEVVKRFKV